MVAEPVVTHQKCAEVPEMGLKAIAGYAFQPLEKPAALGGQRAYGLHHTEPEVVAGDLLPRIVAQH